MNPIIKFTTLFGLLATEIAVTMTNKNLRIGIGSFFFSLALVFVYRSFYAMRIPKEELTAGETREGSRRVDSAITSGKLAVPARLATPASARQNGSAPTPARV